MIYVLLVFHLFSFLLDIVYRQLVSTPHLIDQELLRWIELADDFSSRQIV